MPFSSGWLQANTSNTLTPGVGVVLTTPVKYALAIGGGIVAGGLMLKGGQSLTQTQEQQVKAASGGMGFNVYPGGKLYVYNPKTGSASAEARQEQKGELKTTDLLQYLIIGGLCIAALAVWLGRGKK